MTKEDFQINKHLEVQQSTESKVIGPSGNTEPAYMFLLQFCLASLAELKPGVIIVVIIIYGGYEKT